MMDFLFWGFYFPVIKILTLILLPIPKVRERIAFEKRNDWQGFLKTGQKADLAFEFSSEGEYQQAASLIQDALADGKKIEIVYFSPSVEKAMTELAGKYPLQLKVLRYPLLTLTHSHSFSHWVTSDTLVLVRYDFLPEFLVWSRKPQHKLKILWVSFKKDRLKGRRPSFYKMLFLTRGKKLFFASHKEASFGKLLNLSGDVYDFRIEQIHRRILARLEKFAQSFTLHSELLKKLNPKRVIMGNAWVSDLALIKNIPKDISCLIVPHRLDLIPDFKSTLKSMNLDFQEITTETQSLEEKQIYILNRKGLLCELYHDFDKAYVGGGFEKSVHSLLEPLVAGSKQISCGPQNHRSTEFDLAQDLGHLKEIQSPKDFLEWLESDALKPDVLALQSILKQYARMKEELFHAKE